MQMLLLPYSWTPACFYPHVWRSVREMAIAGTSSDSVVTVLDMKCEPIDWDGVRDMKSLDREMNSKGRCMQSSQSEIQFCNYITCSCQYWQGRYRKNPSISTKSKPLNATCMIILMQSSLVYSSFPNVYTVCTVCHMHTSQMLITV